MTLDLSSVDPTAQQRLINLRAQGQSIIYQGFVVFYWPQPVGTKVYAVAPYDDPFFFPDTAPSLPAQLSPVEVRLVASSPGGQGTDDAYLQNFSLPSDAKDTTIQVTLSNVDHAIEAAYLTNLPPDGNGKVYKIGYGVTVEVFVWMPQQSILKSMWIGYTNPPQSVSGPIVKFTATYGFRSSLRDLPGTAFYPRCFNDFPPEYPQLFPTVASIGAGTPSSNRCTYDAHLGGGHGIPQSVHVCDRTQSPTTGCQFFFGPILNLPYTGMDAIQILNGLPVRQDSKTLNQSVGNNSALSNAIRVVAGDRWVKSCDIVQMTIQTNNDHPEEGSVTLTCIVCEGHIQSLDSPFINDIPVGPGQTHFRLGEIQQTDTGFIPDVPTANFSSRVVLTVVQKGSFAGQAASQFSVTVHVNGLDRIRIYTDAVNYTLGYTTNPAWFILNSYYDRMWGQGIDVSRLVISDWITLAAFYDDMVSGMNPDGTTAVIARSTWNGEWQSRKVPDQLRDAFLYRSTSIPFISEGKIRVVPITKDDLANVPVFTDRFPTDGSYQTNFNNILPDQSGISTSDWGEIPIDKQPTEIEARFDDASLDQQAERPLLVEDLPSEVRAGRVAGDNTITRVKQTHSFTGVTSYPEAVRIANKLLDLGEFDAGGLVNPITWTFETTLLDSLRLHLYKIIKQDSYKLDRMKAAYGFEYFRITGMEYTGLKVKVTAQAYPVDYYNTLEDSTQALPHPGGSPLFGGGGGGGGGGSPFSSPTQPVILIPIIGPDKVEFVLGT